MYSLKPYSPQLEGDWEKALQSAINGTFLHSRNYLEYHGERFSDASLIIYRENMPVGIFPAHRNGEEIHSHQGLTYGGLVISFMLSLENILLMFRELLRYYAESGVRQVHIKDLPSIYVGSSTEWLPYLMFIVGGKVSRSDLTFAVPLPLDSDKYSKGRSWGIKKAHKKGLKVKETQDFRGFWEKVLIPNLWSRHQVQPVHSLEEIQCLANINNPLIRQFEVWDKDELVAGTTVFETTTTAHTQYISSTQQGKEISALDLLIHHLMVEVYSKKSFFDFGIVNMEQGRKINRGLMEWKESFGARPYVHLTYSLDPGNYHLLDGVIGPYPPLKSPL